MSHLMGMRGILFHFSLAPPPPSSLHLLLPQAKCYQYWPELADGTLTLKDITISPVDVVQLAYYTIRSFKVLRGGAQARPVKQFHYTGWPDFGVPDQPHPIIAFIRHLDNVVRRSKGPDIVHCRLVHVYAPYIMQN